MLLHKKLLFLQKHYPLELHFVHFNNDYGKDIGTALTKEEVNDNLAVLGVMFTVQDKDNPKLDDLVKTLTLVQKGDSDTKQMNPFKLVDLLPRNTDGFYRYMKSYVMRNVNKQLEC